MLGRSSLWRVAKPYYCRKGVPLKTIWVGFVLGLMVAFGLAGCVTLGLVDEPGTIREADYGEEWPLTVPEVVVNCDRWMIYVEVDGYAYPVNGTAIAGLEKLKPYLKVRGLKGIWRLDEEFNRAAKQAGLNSADIRIDISPVLDAGIERCERKYGEW